MKNILLIGAGHFWTTYRYAAFTIRASGHGS